MFRFACYCLFGAVAFIGIPLDAPVSTSGPMALWAIPHADAAKRISSRLSYKVYKVYRNKIYKQYRKAVRRRYSRPCRAQRRLTRYVSWLSQLKTSVPNLEMRKRHKRYLGRRIRTYTRLGNRRVRWSRRRCQRYWRREMKRSKSKLRSKCEAWRAADPKQAAKLLIGTRPWAHVYINGKLCGTAPILAHLRPGAYKIRLSYPPGRDEHKVSLQLKVAKKPTYLIHNMKATPKATKKDVGLLSQKQLNFSIARYQSQMRSCKIYQGDAGKVLLSWKISADGKPHTILWVSPLKPNPRFQKCILRAASRMRFPKIQRHRQD